MKRLYVVVGGGRKALVMANSQAGAIAEVARMTFECRPAKPLEVVDLIRQEVEQIGFAEPPVAGPAA